MTLLDSILKFSVKLFFLPSRVLHTIVHALKFGRESIRLGSFRDSIEHLPDHLRFRLKFGSEDHSLLSERLIESMVTKTVFDKRAGRIPDAEAIPEKAIVESTIAFIGTSYWYFPDTAGRMIRKGAARYSELSSEV